MNSRLLRPFRLAAALAVLLLLAAVPAALSQATTPLIPFQGRLTDQNGVPYTNGQFTIFFQLYDQAVGSTPVWQERHEKVGVINGMINVFLGSISPLTSLNFTNTKHLGITVDADNNPNTPDPEMVPRQMIIPAFWARNSDKLVGYDWSSLFGANTPTGTIAGTKITDGSITGAKIAANTITGAKIAPTTITAAQIANDTITSSQIAFNTVTLAKLANEVVTRLVPVGAVSAYAGTNTAVAPSGWLFCDGRAVDRVTFSALFAAIGTAHGAGDGATTFNLPDYRWTFLRGYGSNITVLGTGTVANNQATFANHGFNRSGVKVRLSSGSLSGLAGGNDYWVIVVNANTLAFASSKANAVASPPVPLAISGGNSAVIVQWEDPDLSSRSALASGGFAAGIGTYQEDAFKTHAHRANGGDNSGLPPGLIAIPVVYGRDDGVWRGQTAFEGKGNETRPQNIYVNYIIKY